MDFFLIALVWVCVTPVRSFSPNYSGRFFTMSNFKCIILKNIKEGHHVGAVGCVSGSSQIQIILPDLNSKYFARPEIELLQDGDLVLSFQIRPNSTYFARARDRNSDGNWVVRFRIRFLKSQNSGLKTFCMGFKGCEQFLFKLIKLVWA